jgi:hypothetical protein
MSIPAPSMVDGLGGERRDRERHGYPVIAARVGDAAVGRLPDCPRMTNPSALVRVDPERGSRRPAR